MPDRNDLPGVEHEDAAPEVLAAEQAEEAAAARAPCVPVQRADGLAACGAQDCDFLGGRFACSTLRF